MPKAVRTHLIEARKHRQWSQQEVADFLGTTRHNVSRWEAGLTTPGPYFRAKLGELFGKRPQELGLLTMEEGTEQRVASTLSDHDTPQTSSKQHLPYWHVPFPRNPFFVGRDQVLQALHEALTRQNRMTVHTRSYALYGLGGIGKTQIALEYAYCYASAYTAILWVNAEARETLLASFFSLAEVLNLPEQHERDQQKVTQTIIRWLSEQKDWLLILDNVEDLTLLTRFLPVMRQGSLLITTRLQALGINAQQLGVKPMNAEEAALFLLQRAKLLSPGSAPTHLTFADRLAAQEIVKEMDGLPLALDQAGAYIEEAQCDLENYLQHYRQRRSLLLERRGNSSQDHPASVQTTLALSLQQVAQRNPIAAEMLRLCAFLAADAIPEEIIARGLSSWDEHQPASVTDPWLLDEAIATLGTYSLVQRNPATHTLSVHRLVQAVMQDSLSRQEQEARIMRAITAINLCFPEVRHATRKQCERLIPHALQCVQHTMRWEPTNSELATLLLKTGYYLMMGRCQYQEAEPLLERALQIRNVILGTEHLLVAEALNNLGLVYNWQGKSTQAESLFQQALHIREQALGDEHTAIVQSLNNLGCLYLKQEMYGQAEPLLERAVRVKEQPLDNRLILLLNNLASLYLKQGKCAEAEPLLQRALQIEEQEGITDPDVAYTLSNLARLNAHQRMYAQAELLCKQALYIREQELGSEHLRITPMLCSLAHLYMEQGKYTEAEPLFQRTLQIRKQELGAEHPDMAESQFDFARLYLGQRDFSRSQYYYEQALATWEKTLGLDHPLVARRIKEYSEQVAKDLSS